MATITSTTESWNGHTFSEVESHLKNNYITDAYTKDDLTGTSAVTVAKASSASTASSLSTSTASTVAANDFILLESANGTPVRISRDSFVQAMASVLNSNSQSTISQLFGADANGNHAAINMSNLATVIGNSTGFYSRLAPNLYSFSLGIVNNYNVSITLPDDAHNFIRMIGVAYANNGCISYDIKLNGGTAVVEQTSIYQNPMQYAIYDIWTGVVDGKRVYKINASNDIWNIFGGGLCMVTNMFDEGHAIFRAQDKDITGLTQIYSRT